jgi:predicted type IV restriction endonuclease
MDLEKHIEEIRLAIKAGRFVNEAAVSQGIILRLLHALSWPAYETQIVCPEYSLQGRRVDYELCHPPGKPIAFVEVKQIGQSEGAERQLFEYAFHIGVPLAILTDGQEWNFFIPGEQGDYGERRVYKLDIVERDISECVARLTRYLHYEAIVSGAAIEAAREDYRNVSRDRQMKSTLPKAWAPLLEDEDELLLELVADRVESLCGYKPDPDTVAYFLKEKVALKSSLLAISQLPLRSPTLVPAPIAVPNSQRTRSNQKLSSIGFVLDG